MSYCEVHKVYHEYYEMCPACEQEYEDELQRKIDEWERNFDGGL